MGTLPSMFPNEISTELCSKLPKVILTIKNNSGVEEQSDKTQIHVFHFQTDEQVHARGFCIMCFRLGTTEGLWCQENLLELLATLLIWLSHLFIRVIGETKNPVWGLVANPPTRPQAYHRLFISLQDARNWLNWVIFKDSGRSPGSLYLSQTQIRKSHFKPQYNSHKWKS